MITESSRKVVAVLIIAAVDGGSGCTRCCEYLDDNQKWLGCMTEWPP